MKTTALLFALLVSVSSAAPRNWTSSDGKSFQGWHLYTKKAMPDAGWKVEDGLLKKIAKVRGGDIVTDQVFGDFDLMWEWRVAAAGNNGPRLQRHSFVSKALRLTASG